VTDGPSPSSAGGGQRAGGISRRALLTGAAAAVVALGAGAAYEERHRIRSLEHTVGLVSGPNRAIPNNDARPEYGAFASAAMGRQVRYGVYRPPGTVAAVLVCLHGKDGSEHTAFDGIGVHHFVAERGLPFAVAAVDGGDDSYWHARRDGTDAGRLVVDEFVPMVQQRTGAARVALMGWSMGGYGSLLAAARHPTMFSAVVVGSPALWERADDTAPGAFDDADDFNRNNVFSMTAALARVPLRVDCGNSDPFAPGARALLAAVPSATGGLRPGYHDDAFWRSVMPDQLTFLASHL